MKQKAKKIFTVFMVLTVLVSSHAFAYYEHICLITKEKTYSFKPETCEGKIELPKESKTPEFKRTSCCDLNFKIQKVDNGQQNSVNIQVIGLVLEEFSMPKFCFNPTFSIVEHNSNYSFGNSSPPKQKLFILNDQFLI